MTHVPAPTGSPAAGAIDVGSGPAPSRNGRRSVEVHGVSKRYGGAQALLNVSLRLSAGEVHALVGENGAGKSTLGKIIAGAVQPDAGTLMVNGSEVSFKTPREALAGGIALVRQEISLVPALSVLDNVFLGAEDRAGGVIKLAQQRRRFSALMEETGFELSPNAKVSHLRAGDQQKVEILRAIVRDAWLIIMDEPTAALTADESARLANVVRHLSGRDMAFLYISHDLEEVLSLADSVTVLKDGRLVSTSPAANEEVTGLVSKMLGRPLTTMFPPKRRQNLEDAPVVLEVSGLTRGRSFEDVSFKVRRGEIVGMAGLVGSGRTEVARAVFGADPYDAGSVELNGRPCRIRTPRDAIERGIALVPESRKDQGLVMTSSVAENLVLSAMRAMTVCGLIQNRKERAAAAKVADTVDVRMSDIRMPVAMLSGGNQQKVAIGKWLVRPPSVLIADEPTRGVDVGARFTIYQTIQRLADGGLAVLLISSELEEVMGLADRILVMHRGRLVAELPGDAEEDHILNAAFGGHATGGSDVDNG